MATIQELLQNQTTPQKTLGQKVVGTIKSIGSALIDAPKKLGEDIAQGSKLVKETKKSLDETYAKIKEYGDKTGKYLMSENEYKSLKSSLPERNARQITGDIVETALLAIPVPVFKALKGLPLVSKIARGATAGGAFGATTAIREDKLTAKNLAINTVLGAVGGAIAEPALSLVGKGISKGLQTTAKVATRATEKITEKPFARWLLPAKTELKRFYGKAGENLYNKFEKLDDETITKVGQRISKLEDAGFYSKKWTPAQKQNFYDLSTGKSTTAIDDTVAKSFNEWSIIRDEIAQTAVETGVRVRVRGIPKYSDVVELNRALSAGEISKLEYKQQWNILKKKGSTTVKDVPFTPRENYYPQDVISVETLNKDSNLKREVLEQAVRLKRVESIDEANKLFNAWSEIEAKQGRAGTKNYFINWLIRDGQAKNKDEATGIIYRFFKKARQPRSGKLEYAREMDFPFFDTDPQRVVTKYILDSTERLETIKLFGQSGQQLSQFIGNVKRTMGDDAAKRATQIIETITTPKIGKTTSTLRALQVPKLAFSQIINLGQNLNTLLASDLPSFAKGLSSVFTKIGRQQALRTGAPIESIIRQATQYGGGAEQKWASLFLKYNGFQLTEKFNRMVAANTGREYAKRTFRDLLKNPNNKRLQNVLTELGVDIKSALNKGTLTEQQLLLAGKKLSDITQFRYKPQDFPTFVNTDFGKLAFQFKTYAYNQTVFLKNQLKREALSGEPGRAFRTLITLGTIFPLGGEVLRDIRSLITQEKRPTKFLDRYVSDLMTVGGLGILSDVYTSAKYGLLAETLLGPTAGSIVTAVEGATTAIESGKITPSTQRKILGLVGPLATYPHKIISPVKNQKNQESMAQTILKFIQDNKTNKPSNILEQLKNR